MKLPPLKHLIGGIALSLFTLCAAPAFATQTCANPVDGQTSVNLSITGDCNITTAINVSGTVNITATGNLTDSAAITSSSSHISLSAKSITGTSLTAGSYAFAQSNTGSIKFTGAISVNTDGVGGGVLMKSQTDLATGAITIQPGSASGFVDLYANLAGGTSTFTIDGAVTNNGVNGKIIADATGTNNVNGVLITNGTATGAGSGNIKIGATGAISAKNSVGQSGFIWIQAYTGTITLTGTMNADGTGNFDASSINLSANTVAAPSGATLSAVQSASAPGTSHGIWISAATVSFGGTGGLKILANGDTGQVFALPAGAITFTDDQNLTGVWTIGANVNYGKQGTPLDFSGAGSPLTVNANGNNTYISMQAYPLTFEATNISITATGATNHQIVMNPNGATKTGGKGLSFNATGTTTLDVSGVAGDGGQITIWEDQVSFSGTTATLKANGPTSGNGNGGVLSLLWSNTVLSSTTKAIFAANAASAGFGNGGSIVYWPGANISFGSAANQFAMSAKGGVTGCATGSTCKGGSITIVGADMAFASAQSTAMNVAAGPTGDGGTIDVSGGAISFTGSTYAMTANAGTTQGNGGSVRISAFAALKVGTGAGAVNIAAKGAGTGNGGSVTVAGLPLTLAGANVSVAAGAGTGSNGNGGNVSITSNFGGTITGNIVANGVGTGPGGTIAITTDTGTITGATFTANGGLSGNGGAISLTTTGTNPISINGSTRFTASGGSTTGNGGTLSFTSASNLTIDGGSVVATATGSGNGGTIDVTAGAANTLTISGAWNVVAGNTGDGAGGVINIHETGAISVPAASTLDASGHGAGSGGSITVNNSGTLDLSNVTMAVDGGCNNGDGGTIDLTTTGQVSIGEADGYGSGNGMCSMAVVQPSRFAPRTPGTGKGAAITLYAQQWALAALKGFNFDAHGTGNGGTVTINTNNDIDLSTMAGTAVISAQGGPGSNTTLGGTVKFNDTVIGWPTNRLIDDIIHVSGGKGLAESANDGMITINSVTCQQRNLANFNSSGTNVTYWNCNDSSLLGSVLTSLAPSTKTVYQAAKVRLYDFNNLSAANSWLGNAQVTQVAASYGFSLFAPTNYSVVYFGTSGGGAAFNGAIRHEVGHQVDNYDGNISQSAYMNDLMTEDWNSFKAIATCTLWPNPPVCNAGVAQSPYSGLNNQQILGGTGGSTVGIPVYFNPPGATPPGTPWREIFAEEFALGAGGGIGTATDGWLSAARSYFKCSEAYVNSVYANGKSATPSYPAGCTIPSHPQP